MLGVGVVLVGYGAFGEEDILIENFERWDDAGWRVDGDENNRMWVIHDGTGNYLCGDFDGKRYRPKTALIVRNYGDCFYSGQAFSNAPNGRVVEMAWGT